MHGIGLKEWGGVALVGVLLGGTLRAVGLHGAALGAAAYLLGYLVRGKRPTKGWLLPGPIAAYLPGPSGPASPDVIDVEEVS